MKKLFLVTLSMIMMLSLGACNNQPSKISEEEKTIEPSNELSQEPTHITITTFNGSKELMELEVPYNPQRIAVMDLATLDMIDNFDLGERVVGVSKGSSIDYLQGYVTDNKIINLGTIKEADLESVMECEPDVIFIGGRLSAQYDALSKIAPVVFLATDTEIGLVESVSNNAMTVASMFGLEDKVSSLITDFDNRIKNLSDFTKDKTAVIGLVTSGSFNILGNDGRCSIIGVEVGFDNLGDEDVTSTHGNESSFELLISMNPEYIFVMDRDAAINTEGAKLAQEIMENELVMKTDAYQNNNLIYLDNPAVWYTAEGGITALDVMLSDLETNLLK